MNNNDLLTKRQRLRKAIELLILSFGGYQSLFHISPDKVKRVVFICHGNICRSALADWHMKKKEFDCESFGLACDDGDIANDTMQEVAREKGIELAEHRTASAENFKIKDGDLFVAMEPGQIERLKKLLGRAVECQYTLLGMYCKPQKPTIIDPYGKQKRFFDETADDIILATDNLHRAITMK